MLGIDEVEARLEALKESREKFIQQVNLEIAAFNARIDELEHLIQPAPQPEETPAQ